MVINKTKKQTLKTAEYYIDRIKDLPSLLRGKIRDLKQEVESHRLIILSLQELCAILELDYTKDVFESNCKENFAAISKYIDKFSLKFVPCSIPVDLQFEDQIFLVPKPNLDNDEDCASVRDIVVKRKKPSAKDLQHISRMNEKLSNYNVMLRVFEALFVVSSNHLGAHQRYALNNFISELVLPIEGLNYLRACYTFASERRNYHCDFGNPRFCFKPLNAQLQQRIDTCLAMIAASNSYPQPFDSSYPHLEQLQFFYQKYAHTLHPASDSYIEHNQDESGIIYPVQNSGFTATMRKANSLSSKQNAAKPRTDVIEANRQLLSTVSERLHLQGPFAELLKTSGATAKTTFSEQGIATIKIYSPADPLYRPAGFLLITDNSSVYESFPFMLFTANSPEEVLTQDTKRGYLDFLKNSGTDPDGNNLRLYWNLVFVLILRPLICGDEAKGSTPYETMLEEEYAQNHQKALLYIKTLRYALFCSDSKTLPDNHVKQGLFLYQDILRFLLLKILIKHEGQTAHFSAMEMQLFKIYRLSALCRVTHSLNPFVKKAALTPAALNYALNLLDSNGYDDLKNTLVIEQTERSEKLGSWDFDSEIERPLQLILSHALCKICFSSLLVKSSIERFTGLKIRLHHDFIAGGKQILTDHFNELSYLQELKPSDNPLVLNLIIGKLSTLEMQQFRRKLKNFEYHDITELYNQLSVRYTTYSDACIDLVLKQCRLLKAPMDAALPPEVRNNFKRHKIIECELPDDEFNTEFVCKLGAAQLVITILSFIKPSANCEVKLTSHMELTPRQQVFALSYLKTVKLMTRGARPFADSVYGNIFSRGRNTESFRLFISYLKTIAREEIASSGFTRYTVQLFGRIFSLLHQPRNEYTELMSAKKPVKHNADSLDFDIIRAKQKETAQLEEVITKIRDEENSSQSTDIQSEVLKEQDMNKNTTATQIQQQDSNPENSSATPKFADNVVKLIEALAAESAEVMDLNEFSGLCISLKFMSCDAAIEELNDLCYEEFDEPLFDKAPEENSVYITLDILSKLSRLC